MQHTGFSVMSTEKKAKQNYDSYIFSITLWSFKHFGNECILEKRASRPRLHSNIVLRKRINTASNHLLQIDTFILIIQNMVCIILSKHIGNSLEFIIYHRKLQNGGAPLRTRSKFTIYTHTVFTVSIDSAPRPGGSGACVIMTSSMR